MGVMWSMLVAAQDTAQQSMRYIIWGLIALAVVVAIGTLYFWARTRPPLVTELSDGVTVTPVEPVSPDAPVTDEAAALSVQQWGETYAPLPTVGTPEPFE